MIKLVRLHFLCARHRTEAGGLFIKGDVSVEYCASKINAGRYGRCDCAGQSARPRKA